MTLERANRRAGVNFINILQVAFSRTNPKTQKIRSIHQYLFAILESLRVKVLPKMFMKLTPGVISSTFYDRLFVQKRFANLLSNYTLALKFFGGTPSISL